jgi:hypothetical protein
VVHVAPSRRSREDKYDDTTNVTWARGPIAAAAHEVGYNPN